MGAFISSSRYPIWSARTITFTSLAVLLTSVLLIFLVGDQSPLVKAELLTASMALLMFTFLSCALFKGVRVHKREQFPELTALEEAFKQNENALGDVPFKAVGAADDLAGLVVGLMMFVVLLVVGLLLLPLIMNVLWVGVFMVIAAAFWIVHRGLRYVLVYSRSTRGDLGKSVWYALRYTMVYSGWLFGLLAIARYWLDARTA